MSDPRAAVVWSAHISRSENTTLYQRSKILNEEYDCDFYLFGDCNENYGKEFDNIICVEKDGIISGLKFMISVIYMVGIAGRKDYNLVHTSYHPLACIIGFFCSFSIEKWVHDIWDHPLRTVPEPSKSMAFSELVLFLSKYSAERVSRYVMSSADRIVLSLHPSIVDQLEFGEVDLITIPNGTNLGVYMDIENYNAEEFTVVYVGAITPERAELILQAAAVAKEQIDQFTVLLVGEPWDKKLLKKRISQYNVEGCLRTTGYLSHDEALRRIAIADVGLCLLPRSKETEYVYPIKLFEYMALGTVPISSNLKGAASVIDNQETGYLVTPENGEEAGEIIAEVHRNETKQVAESAQKAVKDYDWGRINDQFRTAICFG